MNRVALSAIVAGVLCCADVSLAQNRRPTPKPASCNVVGIVSTNQFLAKSQRKCFQKTAQANKKGFTQPFSAASSEPTLYSFNLSGANEVPPNQSTSTGTCVGTLNAARTQLVVACAHTVTNPSGGHIHVGPAGVNGPIICQDDTPASPLQITCAMDADRLASLDAGNLYVNIHSLPNFGAGEIRGQIAAAASSSQAGDEHDGHN